MRRCLAVLTCALLLTGVWRFGASAPAIGDDNVVDGSSITLTKCRVKLIHEAVLASDRPGILAFVEPKEGDRVTAKQNVAGLNDKVARAQYAVAQKRAESDIEKRYAVKAHEVAEVEHQKAVEANERFQQVLGKYRGNDDKLAVPQSELRRLRLSADKAELQIEQADHEFTIHELEAEQAAAELETYQVAAPFDGVVTRVHKKEGEAVRQGDPILEVVSTDRLRVEGRVDIKDLWRIKQGDPVEVHIDFDDVELQVEKEVFAGRLVFIDLTVEPVTKKVVVYAEVDNRDSILKAGLPARMKIFTTGDATTAKK
jgi:RND family efflux transporter MFP subunit